MKRTHILRSVIVFSLFSLVGPMIQRSPLPPFLSVHREELTFLLWPGVGLSAGGPANSDHDLWMSVIGNVVLFALLGVIAAAVGRRVGTALMTYVCLCALIALVEASGSGFSLAYFSWSVLAIVCFFYWLPFWVIIWMFSGPSS